MEREVCTRQKGVLSFAPPPPMGKEIGTVRVIEVWDPGLRGKEAGFHVPVLSAFLSLTGTGDPRGGRSSDACCLQARRFRGRPAGLARPRAGFHPVQDQDLVALTPLSACPLRTPTPKTKPARQGSDT